MKHAHEVLTFWFEEIEPAQWWRKNLAFDAEIRRRFGALHTTATSAGLPLWRRSIEGRLAEVIVLDQFSRNLFRGDPRAFASDTVAVQLATEAIALGLDDQLVPVKRAFYICRLCTANPRHINAPVLNCLRGSQRQATCNPRNATSM